MAMHHGATGTPVPHVPAGGIVRRLIFLRVDSPGSTTAPAALFGINSTREPQFVADVDIHNLVLLDLLPLGPGTGWGRVPTPMF
jgi:hypothetical protein